MPKCRDCGQTYRTKKGLEIHRDLWHPRGQTTLMRNIWGSVRKKKR